MFFVWFIFKIRYDVSTDTGAIVWLHTDSKVAAKQSGRSPKVVALFSATNFSSYIIKLLQLHDKIQIKWNYAWIHYNIATRRHLMI